MLYDLILGLAYLFFLAASILIFPSKGQGFTYDYHNPLTFPIILIKQLAAKLSIDVHFDVLKKVV